MKSLVSIVVALGLAVAFADLAFAGATPNTKEACQAAGMHWDGETNTCHKGPKN